MSDRAQQIHDHFDGEAAIFDDLILKLIPDYRAMVAALVGALPFEAQAPIRVLDLGCGTGTIARAVVGQFPQARLTCVDVAASMIAAAREKLAGREADFVVGDFASVDLGGPYEAVVSSLALHHLEAEAEKRAMYGRIFAALAPGGVFVNADVVLGGSDWLSRRAIEGWAEWMAANVGWGEVRNTWLPKHEAEDRPARLVDHIDWLRGVGFVDVDVLWKRLNFAVYCARRAELRG
jgi:tRNA (cmo5U34)-methyltransferase